MAVPLSRRDGFDIRFVWIVHQGNKRKKGTLCQLKKALIIEGHFTVDTFNKTCYFGNRLQGSGWKPLNWISVLTATGWSEIT